MGTIYHQIGTGGFWIDEQYVGKLVALKKWTYPDEEAEVVGAADTMSELELKLGDRMWMSDGGGTRSRRPVCRILSGKAPK